MSAMRMGITFALVGWLAGVTLVADGGQQGKNAITLTGTWQLDVKIPNANGKPRMTVTQKGEQLTGQYSGATIGDTELTGTIKGKNVTFTVVGKTPAGPVTLTYTGTVTSSAAMEGKVEVSNGMTGTFTGAKQAKAK